jgi:Na+-transporting NADH:ubiquinone oxidoreductase subunit C
MNRDSNRHTYIFAAIMVISVASVLSFTSESLKDLQNANIKKEKMQSILSTVGINVSRDESEQLYNEYISEELSLRSDGSVDNEVNAFNINLALEVKKDNDIQRYPLYIANVENEKF